MRRTHVASLLAVWILAALAVGPAGAQTPVFINEIHYDNSGTDAGEAGEVAGPAGTDLTDWSIMLYNGGNSMTYIPYIPTRSAAPSRTSAAVSAP